MPTPSVPPPAGGAPGRPRHVRPVALAAVAALPGVRPGPGLGDAGGAPAGRPPHGPTGDRRAAVLVTGVSMDSRRVQPGDLYVAPAGERAHGADFAGQAAAAGAVAVLTDPAGVARAAGTGLPVLLAERPRAVLGEVSRLVYADPSADLTVVGITGTNGKTTTAHLVDAALAAAGWTTGLVGTVGATVAGERVPVERTTPEACDLLGLLALMRERGVRGVSMEVSSHALAIGRVDGTVVDVAGFTGMTVDHLDFHGTVEAYHAAKMSLFTPQRARHGVVNLDGAGAERLLAAARVPCTTVSAGGDPRADWRAGDVRVGPSGSRLRVHAPDGSVHDAQVGLPGAVNVANALLAIGCAVAAGSPLPAALAGVAGLRAVPGRIERVDAGQPYLAVVDYAHTPDAIQALLDTLRPLTRGRLIAVGGAAGDRDPTKRPQIGALLVRTADLSFITSENPRRERPIDILDEIEAGALAVPPGERRPYVVEPDRARAIAAAVAAARPGDTVVCFGKGHETVLLFDGYRTPHDDRAVLRAAITSRGAGTEVLA